MNEQDVLAAWRESIPDIHYGSYRRQWDKAMARKSMRSAVTAKCQDCTCWQKAEIRDCAVITCPLYRYRPYQPKNVADVQSDATA